MYVVCDVVSNGEIRDIWLCVRREVSFKFVGRLVGRQGRTERMVGGSNTLYTKVRQPIMELVVFDVHQQTEVMQEDSDQDGLPNICNDECPTKCAPKTEIESE